MSDETSPIETSGAAISRLRSRLDALLAPLTDGAPFALVDYPDHANVGDSAIWLGETAFFRTRGLQPAYVSTIASHDHDALAAAVPEGTIFLHGGGNFGTLWPSHQDFRLDLLARFPGRPIVQLPQSIFFADQASVDASARAIERHGRFTLYVRDKPSFDFARRHFPCETILAPDMAFAIGPLAGRSGPADVVHLLRTDLEKAERPGRPADSPHETAVDWLEDDVKAMRMATLGSRLLTFAHPPEKARVRTYERRARTRLRRGVSLLSSGRVVVTDRLHGHILSTLLGKPHVVLDNSYRKIGNFIDAWTSDLAVLRLATDFDEARSHASALLAAASGGSPS